MGSVPGTVGSDVLVPDHAAPLLHVRQNLVVPEQFSPGGGEVEMDENHLDGVVDHLGRVNDAHGGVPVLLGLVRADLDLHGDSDRIHSNLFRADGSKIKGSSFELRETFPKPRGHAAALIS